MIAGERLISNLARLVMAVWLFVVLILSSSYTASLSSRLTVQRLRPTVTDVKELIKNGDSVGYQYGSFTFDILKGMGFEESKLKPQKSREDCDEAMSNGGKSGGISAFFDVVPYNKVFLSKYCGQYTAVGPIYRTDGFGFVSISLSIPKNVYHLFVMSITVTECNEISCVVMPITVTQCEEILKHMNFKV